MIKIRSMSSAHLTWGHPVSYIFFCMRLSTVWIFGHPSLELWAVPSFALWCNLCCTLCVSNVIIILDSLHCPKNPIYVFPEMKLINRSQRHECGNWDTERYDSVLEITRPRSFISGNTYTGIRHLYWILTGPHLQCVLRMCIRNLISWACNTLCNVHVCVFRIILESPLYGTLCATWVSPESG